MDQKPSFLHHSAAGSADTARVPSSGFVAEIQLLVMTTSLRTSFATASGVLSNVPRYHTSPSRPASATATALRALAVSIPTKTSFPFFTAHPLRVEAPGPSGQPRSIRTQAASDLNSAADMRS